MIPYVMFAVASYEDYGLVVIGAFNPMIFQPDWFRAKELLPATEIDAVMRRGPEQSVVSREGTVLHFESLRLEVVPERIQLTTSRADWKSDIGSLAAAIFELLPHSPIQATGFNILKHWVPKHAASAKILERWAPVQPLAQLAGTPMRCGAKVTSEWEGFELTVALEPSLRLVEGLFLGQGYEKRFGKKGQTDALSTLRDGWPQALKNAVRLAEAIDPETA